MNNFTVSYDTVPDVKSKLRYEFHADLLLRNIV